MATVYNIYCDESCHLENDRERAMVLGAVWCPLDIVRKESLAIKQIKIKHNLSKDFEIKWTKVSFSKIDFYKEIVNYFFDNENLHFRALIVPDKTKLNHSEYPGQDHEQFYYKMYFQMLHPIFNPNSKYRIYLDIKDTLGIIKQQKLHEVLCNKQRDFQKQIIQKVQQIKSHESELMQVADLLIGAVSYRGRNLDSLANPNQGKIELIKLIETKTGYQINQSTFLGESKFNLFKWQATEFNL
jgi:hypothetical protein